MFMRNEGSLVFEIIESSPVNHTAVTEAFIDAVGSYAWEEANVVTGIIKGTHFGR
jgi:hypothetical protein